MSSELFRAAYHLHHDPSHGQRPNALGPKGGGLEKRGVVIRALSPRPGWSPILMRMRSFTGYAISEPLDTRRF